MPPYPKPKSARQRRAMRAAEAGDSTLGIPKSVGADYSKGDTGGKLPETAPKKGSHLQDLVNKSKK